MYKIKQYSKEQAQKLGVTIKPSQNPKKKIDVYKNGEKVASIGATGFKDFPTYIETNGKQYAEKRRELYKIRHAKDRNKKGTAGYYADRILW